jgi:hypothetical protein
MALLASKAFPAVQVRLNCATVAGFYVLDPFAHGQYFHAQFVTRDSRVIEKGKLAQVTAYVRAAYSHARGTNQGFAGAWVAGVLDFNAFEFLGCGKLQCFHFKKRCSYPFYAFQANLFER